jgi:hypothetical protein
MKKFEYKEIDTRCSEINLGQLGKDGWELCATTVSSWIFKREISNKDIHIGLLTSCAYIRNVSNLQHRTIGEFAQFVESVMKGDFPKYEFDWNEKDAIETWIEKFHEHCQEQYRDIELRMNEASTLEQQF